MPRYEFECKTCGTPYTLTLRVEDRYAKLRCTFGDCPGHLRRLYSAPHVAMVPGTYTRYQSELDAKALERAKRRDKAIKETREREAKADTLRSPGGR